DGVVSRRDFQNSAGPWLSVIFNGPAVLVVVDVQNDFISGSLALKSCEAGQDGAEVVPVINRALDRCASQLKTVVYSLDWHPDDHISFIDKCRTARALPRIQGEISAPMLALATRYGPVEQMLWPKHCVQNSHGAELHPLLKVTSNHIRVHKGTDPDIDSYSAFWDNGKRKRTDLFDQLHRLQVRDVFVCGLATDVCVGATATHSVEHGFRTALLEDASRGVSREGIVGIKSRLASINGLVVNSSQASGWRFMRRVSMAGAAVYAVCNARVRAAVYAVCNARVRAAVYAVCNARVRAAVYAVCNARVRAAVYAVCNARVRAAVYAVCNAR
uniref:nicotinamidase n=1 Tax=Macrostomum lignano TaxID=282301 RepID=A0A1I8GH48_9PLAT